MHAAEYERLAPSQPAPTTAIRRILREQQPPVEPQPRAAAPFRPREITLQGKLNVLYGGVHSNLSISILAASKVSN